MSHWRSLGRCWPRPATQAGWATLPFFLNNGESATDNMIQALTYALGRAGIQVLGEYPDYLEMGVIR
jgi:hypothetical protein